MKRPLEADNVISTFPSDVAEELHKNLVFYDICLPTDLCNWHTACRAYYKKWCNREYFLLLITMATQKAIHLYERTSHADYFGAEIHLSQMCLAEALCHRLLTIYKPRCGTTLSRRNVDLTTSFLHGECTASQIVKEIDGPLGDEWLQAVPRRVGWLFRVASKYLRARYGWKLVFEHKVDKKQGIVKYLEEPLTREDVVLLGMVKHGK
jgi:hypothetical protein